MQLPRTTVSTWLQSAHQPVSREVPRRHPSGAQCVPMPRPCGSKSCGALPRAQRDGGRNSSDGKGAPSSGSWTGTLAPVPASRRDSRRPLGGGRSPGGSTETGLEDGGHGARPPRGMAGHQGRSAPEAIVEGPRALCLPIHETEMRQADHATPENRRYVAPTRAAPQQTALARSMDRQPLMMQTTEPGLPAACYRGLAVRLVTVTRRSSGSTTQRSTSPRCTFKIVATPTGTVVRREGEFGLL